MCILLFYPLQKILENSDPEELTSLFSPLLPCFRWVSGISHYIETFWWKQAPAYLSLHEKSGKRRVLKNTQALSLLKINVLPLLNPPEWPLVCVDLLDVPLLACCFLMDPLLVSLSWDQRHSILGIPWNHLVKISMPGTYPQRFWFNWLEVKYGYQA